MSNLPPCLDMERFLAGEPSDRNEVYGKILSLIEQNDRGNGPLLMVCKEDPAIVRPLEFRTPRCKCLA